MKVRELLTILNEYHPDEIVGFRSVSKRNMTILGIDRERTTEVGHLVFQMDFTLKDKEEESPRDILVRQGEQIKKAIKKLDKEEREALDAAATKFRHRQKKTRTATQQLLDGYIPNGRGRPRKMVTEEDIIAKQESQARGRGRPKKTTDAEESNQFSNQSEEKSPIESTE